MQSLTEAQYLGSRLDRLEISRQDFAISCSRLMGTAVGCRRVRVWVVGTGDVESTLVCIGGHDAVIGPLLGVGLELSSRSDFLRALERDGSICAPDARTHVATSRLYQESLARQGIESMLAVAFSINGELHGVFTCVSIGEQAQWTAHQTATAKRIVARVSPALARAVLRFPSHDQTDFRDAGKGASPVFDHSWSTMRYAATG